jgi:signal transduction histidine kinase
VWQVDELPPVDELRPSTVFSLQRIVLEAAANARTHSDTSELRFIARAGDGGDVEIRIEDDGRGFDPALARAGPGLADMRARAQRIGARFQINSQPGRGTVVRLTLSRMSQKTSVEREGAATEVAQMLQPAPATQAV